MPSTCRVRHTIHEYKAPRFRRLLQIIYGPCKTTHIVLLSLWYSTNGLVHKPLLQDYHRRKQPLCPFRTSQSSNAQPELRVAGSEPIDQTIWPTFYLENSCVFERLTSGRRINEFSNLVLFSKYLRRGGGSTSSQILFLPFRASHPLWHSSTCYDLVIKLPLDKR